MAAERGVGVIINQPFDSGSLFARVKGKTVPAWASEFDCTSWAQFFLKFLIAHPAVTCVIPGTASPDHARDNIAAGIGRMPDEASGSACSRMAEDQSILRSPEALLTPSHHAGGMLQHDAERLVRIQPSGALTPTRNAQSVPTSPYGEVTI